MYTFKLNLKIIGQIIFVIIFFSTLEAKNLDKFNEADRVSDYFSGILLLNDNQYNESFNFLKKLNGLEESHINYSIKYIYSLVNSGYLKEAFNYSRKLETQKLDSFESNLITGVFYLKDSNLELAKKYFLKAKTKNSRFILGNYVSNSLYNWSSLKGVDINYATLELKKLDERFENLNEDFKEVLNYLKLDSNIELLHINNTKTKNNKHYKKNYNDKTKNLVYDLNKDYIEKFKYEF